MEERRPGTLGGEPLQGGMKVDQVFELPFGRDAWGAVVVPGQESVGQSIPLFETAEPIVILEALRIATAR